MVVLQLVVSVSVFFQSFLGEEQYFPLGTAPIFDNRLFAEYHAQCITKYEDALVNSLVTGTSKAGVIFVTVAFGVGIDCRYVQRVIHIGVPTTMEEFFQEAGRVHITMAMTFLKDVKP